jgi:hypothetical protein
MKIDKTTGDALSNWNCPQCSKSVPAKADDVNDKSVIPNGDQKHHAQENFAKPVFAQQPLLDISPHAPNPMTLWPPLGLRGSKESVEALGQVGESDNEDFVGPIQPSESDYSQLYVPSSVASSSILSFSQTPMCQLVASAANSSSSSVFCQPVSSSAGMAPLSQNQGGISHYIQKTVPTNTFAVSSSLPSQSAKTTHPPTAFPRPSLAPATAFSAAKPGNQMMTNPLNSTKINNPATALTLLSPAPASTNQTMTNPLNSTMTNPLNSTKTNYPATSLTQLSLAPASTNQTVTNPLNSTKTNYPAALKQFSLAPAPTFASSSTALHAARPGNLATTNSLNTMGLNGAELSVAVANLDAFVLAAGDSPGFGGAPSTATQGNIVKSAPSKSDQPSVL